MIRDLEIGETLNIPENGKFAVVFHIPGHCAGCKRVVSILQKLNLDNWEIILVDAENEAFANLVQEHNVSFLLMHLSFFDVLL